MVNPNIDNSLKILAMLGECPSTSFHENLVFQCIKRILSLENIPYKTDTYGNILARIEGTKPQNKPVAFVAHMDHPGFEVDRIENGQVIAKALGGVPIASIKKVTKSFSFDEKTGERYSCVLEPETSIGDREVLVDSNQDLSIGMPIVFDLPDFLVFGGFGHDDSAASFRGARASRRSPLRIRYMASNMAGTPIMPATRKNSA